MRLRYLLLRRRGCRLEVKRVMRRRKRCDKVCQWIFLQCLTIFRSMPSAVPFIDLPQRVSSRLPHQWLARVLHRSISAAEQRVADAIFVALARDAEVTRISRQGRLVGKCYCGLRRSGLCVFSASSHPWALHHRPLCGCRHLGGVPRESPMSSHDPKIRVLSGLRAAVANPKQRPQYLLKRIC